MTTRIMATPTGSVTRIGDARFAEAEEEREAMRASLLSTCQRDRSAVQHAADVFKVDASVVYRWIDGEIRNHPLRAFCDLQDACIAVKGTDSSKALELARLVYRRYLVGDSAGERREVVATCADALREAGEAIGVALSAVADGCVTGDEAKAVCREVDEAVERLNRLRAQVLRAAGASR